ncbi:MAG: hypothetical protein AAB932_03280, partial [Patescibacteria group bacterium]
MWKESTGECFLSLSKGNNHKQEGHMRPVSVEHHGNFAQELAIAGRQFYGGRALVGDCVAIVLPYEPDPHHIDFLRAYGLGPDIIRVGDVYADAMRGATADLIRRHGIQLFWVGTEEAEVLRELGIRLPISPAMMQAINCKGVFRKIGAAMGVQGHMPLHALCRTHAEARDAWQRLSHVEADGHPIPDAIIVKRRDLLSGAGMHIVRTREELDRAVKDMNGHEYIVEAAYTTHVSASAHWDATNRGLIRAGVTLQLISHGVTHEGNVIAFGEAMLPGVSRDDEEMMYGLGEPFVRFWHAKRRYRGMFGIDIIRVLGLDRRTRSYAIEPNAFRPPAPRYAMALWRQIASR